MELEPKNSVSCMVNIMLKAQRNNDLWSLHNAVRSLGGAVSPPDSEPYICSTVEGVHVQYQTTKIVQRVVLSSY